MSDLVIRSGAFEELDLWTAYRLWQLRESVFVVEQSCPYQELDGRDLEPATRHLWAVAGDQTEHPVAYLRILRDGEEERIGRVLVARSHRGRGVAERLMHAALASGGQRTARLDAQSYLHAWYVRFGFEQDGDEFLEDGIPHIPMRRPPVS